MALTEQPAQPNLRNNWHYITRYFGYGESYPKPETIDFYVEEARRIGGRLHICKKPTTHARLDKAWWIHLTT